MADDPTPPDAEDDGPDGDAPDDASGGADVPADDGSAGDADRPGGADPDATADPDEGGDEDAASAGAGDDGVLGTGEGVAESGDGADSRAEGGDDANGGAEGGDDADGRAEGDEDAEEPAEAGEAGERAEDGEDADEPAGEISDDVPPDVRKYQRFKKVDGAQYDRVNDFLRERTYVTAREWAIARLCADFRTETGVEMTKIGENLDLLVPFMEDTYSPQAVNQARSSFEEKVHKAGATFLYGAMCDFFTAEELDELMYEVTEVAKFLLEVEGVDLSVEDELDAEDRISGVMREVREASEALRYEECPHCGESLND